MLQTGYQPIIDDRVEAVPLEQLLRMQSSIPRPNHYPHPPIETI
jgi:hypothetical protein